MRQFFFFARRMTHIHDIYLYARQELASAYTPGEIDHLVFLLLEDRKGISRTDLLHIKEVSQAETDQLKADIRELKENKPVQYILGYAWFCGLKFSVNETTLIPRPETEELVERIFRGYNNGNPASILDIGTGSGCIAVSLKKKFPETEVWGLDISDGALKVAEENAKRNGATVTFISGDILSEEFQNRIDRKFDCIVSNPPYVRASDRPSMDERVIRFEPHLALFVNDDDALLFYRRIADFAIGHLHTGGLLYFEINAHMHDDIEKLLYEKGFQNVEVSRDMSGNYRFCSCRLESSE